VKKSTLELVSRLPHAFVVGFRFAHLVAISDIALGMEYVGGGDLSELLFRQGPLNPTQALFYMFEILLALGHMHSFDVMHRDVKPEHVLIGLDGHVKVANFASAKHMIGRVGDTPPPARTNSLAGTPEFMAPEVILSKPSYEASDLWSAGCLVAEVLTGRTPFNDPDKPDLANLARRIIHEEIVLPTGSNVGLPERDLLTKLLVRDPELRLGARPHGYRAVIAHPWFRGIPEAQVLHKQLVPPWVPHLVGQGAYQATNDQQPSQLSTDLMMMAANHAQGAQHAQQLLPLTQAALAGLPVIQEYGSALLIDAAVHDDDDASSVDTQAGNEADEGMKEAAALDLEEAAALDWRDEVDVSSNTVVSHDASSARASSGEARAAKIPRVG